MIAHGRMKIYAMILSSLFLFLPVYLTGCSSRNQKNDVSSSLSSASSVSAGREEPSSHLSESSAVSPKSREEIIALVEKEDPYQLKPTMSAKERYDLRKKIYSEMNNDEVSNFVHVIDSSALQLESVLSDNRYQELIDPANKRWDAYDGNHLFGIAVLLKTCVNYTQYEPLKNDLNAVISLSESGLKERNVLKIIDANRILQDLSRHLIRVPYREGSDAVVDYGDIHNLYFKVTETLEGKQNLLSSQ